MSTSVTFQSEGRKVVSSEMSKERVFIRLSLVTVNERFAAVPGVKYSCCDESVTLISSLAATGGAVKGSNTALNIKNASIRQRVRFMASPRRGVTRNSLKTTAGGGADDAVHFQLPRSSASFSSSNCSQGKNPSSRASRPKWPPAAVGE